MVLVRTLPVTSLIDNFDPAMVICAVVMMDKWTLGHHLSAAVHHSAAESNGSKEPGLLSMCPPTGPRAAD